MMKDLDAHAPETPSASAVQRTMAILECLDSSRRGLNVSEVSRKLEIPKSSVHVLMLSLERLGYIRRASNGRDFCLGLKVYALGQRMAKTITVAEIALPYMQALVDELSLCAHLAVLDHDQGVFIQKAEPAGSIHFDTYIGRRMDLHCTSVGKVILAFAHPESTEHIFSKRAFMRYTPTTITSGQALRKEVTRVRRTGYAIDNEEEELGARCVAVPVLHEGVSFVAALSVAGSIAQMEAPRVEDLVQRLRECAVAIAADDLPPPPLW
ncbi:MAG: IclR family transcriptional regulator [Candidatus Solibacter sp.]